MVVVEAEEREETSFVDVPATPVVRNRHIPRGTILPALLESTVVSDNLDSRVRAVLLEDFELAGM